MDWATGSITRRGAAAARAPGPTEDRRRGTDRCVVEQPLADVADLLDVAGAEALETLTTFEGLCNHRIYLTESYRSLRVTSPFDAGNTTNR